MSIYKHLDELRESDDRKVKIVKESKTYCVKDCTMLKHLTLSETSLYQGMKTSGHSHEGLEEVYFFNEGTAVMILGDDKFLVKPGDKVLIPAGVFHQVVNAGDCTCRFTCVFESYDRKDKNAIKST